MKECSCLAPVRQGKKHKRGLKAFEEEHPDCRMILVSLDPITRKSGDVELIYVLDFLKMLWNGEIF